MAKNSFVVEVTFNVLFIKRLCYRAILRDIVLCCEKKTTFLQTLYLIKSWHFPKSFDL